MTDRRASTDAAAGLALTGRGILVTGPDGPLTHGIARAAVERGARVGLATAGGGDQGGLDGLLHFAATLDTETDVDQLFDRAQQLASPDGSGATDVEIVIAVVATEAVPELHDLTLEHWRAIIAKPLRRIFWLTRRTVEGFLADGAAGRLVLVIEPVADGDGGNDVLEGALVSLTRSFAREYGRRGLACNLVFASRDQGTAGTPTTDPVTPLIEHALFLASPAASFVNGETLAVTPAKAAEA